MNLDFTYGYREFGRYRKPIWDKEELIRNITYNNGIEPCFLSVCMFDSGTTLLTSLPFDFDSKNIHESLHDALKLYNVLLAFNYDASLIFSGKKGFHVHIYTDIKHYNSKIIRKTQMFFRNILKLKTLDTHVFGQANRLMRIPGTIHEESMKMCRTLHRNHGRKIDLYEFSNVSYDEIYEEIENYDETNHVEEEIIHSYPCIEKHILDEEAEHMVRFGWVLYRKLLGYSKDDVSRELHEKVRDIWEDYEYRRTQQQINQIYRNNYLMPSCKLYQELGVCLKDKCEWYSWLKK